MIAPGRPLRFLANVVGWWIVLRVAFLLPEPPQLRREPPGFLSLPRLMAASPATIALPVQPMAGYATTEDPAAGAGLMPAAEPDHAPNVRLGLLGPLSFGDPAAQLAPRHPLKPVSSPTIPLARSGGLAMSRWSGSGWLAFRGGGAPIAEAGQLGGSQAGARIRYALDGARTLSATARFSSPIAGAGREAAIGVEWRPSRLPLAVIAEQRIGLDGTPGGPALLAVTGHSAAIGERLTLDAYAQAGAVYRGGTEPFADGAIRLARPIGRLAGLDFDLGGGAWGGAQRGAARLDVGPSAGLRLPVGDRAVRLSLDWRQRIAGDARPGSGLALTIGSDF